MPMAAIDGRFQADDRAELPIDRGREKPMNTTLVASEHHSKDGNSMRSWRIVVFGGIGVLYVASLFVPPLREALAKVFSYFPQ